MSHEAYQKSQEMVTGPREAEYRAFSKSTSALLKASEKGRDDLKALIEAIHANRTLWGALAIDCANPENGLPAATRAQIISLSKWVSRYSSDVMQKGDTVEPLVDVNRIMMQGLSAKNAAA